MYFLFSLMEGTGMLFREGLDSLELEERKQAMRIAAIYDIHGNLPALEAVLSEIEREGVDTIVVGGDVVSGLMPREVIEVLLGLGMRAAWIRGNADREVVMAFDGGELNQDWPEEVREITSWTARQLERDHRDF